MTYQTRNPAISVLRVLMGVVLLLIWTVPAFAVQEADPSVPCAAASVYLSASTGSTVIGCLEDGAAVNVLGTSGRFYRIDCYDMTGYIPMSQVVLESGAYRVQCDPEHKGTVTLQAKSMREALTIRSRLYSVAMEQRGIRYLLGGASRKGFDCSGLVGYVYDKCGFQVGRTCMDLMAQGVIIPRDGLMYGDLVLFTDTGDSGRLASHVGIYIGEGKIVHASSSRGVRIDELSGSYYVEHYLCARRIVLNQRQDTQHYVTRAESLVSEAKIEEKTWVRTRNIP